MRYNELINNSVVGCAGQLRKPAYTGLMVLMDYLAPEFAMRFRQFKVEEAKAWRELDARYTLPHYPVEAGTVEWAAYEKMVAHRRAAFNRLKKCMRIKFERLCQEAYAARKARRVR